MNLYGTSRFETDGNFGQRWQTPPTADASFQGHRIRALNCLCDVLKLSDSL